jgi:hypothetical protein
MGGKLGKSEMDKAYGHSELDTIICISKKNPRRRFFFETSSGIKISCKK